MPENTSQIDDRTAALVAELFRTFGDVSRVKILHALSSHEMNVGAVSRMVGVSESAVSHHLRGLRQMGFVVARRDGKEVFYRIEDKHIVTLLKQGVNHVHQG